MIFKHASGNQALRKIIKLDGEEDIVISSNKNTSANIQIDDESLNGMNLKISFKHGSIYMSADHSNFVEIYRAPSVLYKLFPEERHQL
jgi:hypothetical protein